MGAWLCMNPQTARSASKQVCMSHTSAFSTMHAGVQSMQQQYHKLLDMAGQHGHWHACSAALTMQPLKYQQAAATR